MNLLNVKNLLEKIHSQNENFFKKVEYENKEYNYQELYKAFWVCNIRIKNSIELLEVIASKEND
ncbi:hypothetical protein NSQ95_13955 [Psychrobacillus sp. FSL W7-1457]|uniref:hypothetical protein n=1 Tax=Psychrobacillus sp. FSL W7-1457 TaxID=2954547 RepID=UPI00315A804B